MINRQKLLELSYKPFQIVNINFMKKHSKHLGARQSI